MKRKATIVADAVRWARSVLTPLGAASLLALSLAGCSVAVESAEPSEEGPTSSISQDVIDPQLCELIADRANGADHEMVMAEVRSALVGRRTSVGVRDGKYLEVTDVRSLRLDGCRAHLRLGLRLRRPGIRRDATGYADVSGTLFAAKQWRFESSTWVLRDRACLRDMDTDNITLSNTANIGQAIFERNADKKNGDCFAANTLWVTVESGIAEGNALIDQLNAQLPLGQQIPRLPPLTYEQLTPWAP